MNIYTRGVGLLALTLGLGSTAFADGDALVGPPEPARTSSVSKLDAVALSRQIDQALLKRLASEKVPVSSASSDAEFLRRVTLDLTGTIPTPEKVAAFLDSKETDKRAKVIEKLLASPGYGRHMADIWQGLLLPRTSDNRRVQAQPLNKWLEDSFNANKPWNQMVEEIVTATGPQNENGAVTFFLVNPTADKMTDTVSRQFLGIQLQCAQCHNHPFTGWKQTEYWGMATFFSKVRTGNGKKGAKKGAAVAMVDEDASGKARRKLPTNAKIVPAKFLQGEEPKLEPSDPLRPVLAKWMTSAENPFFAQAMVNRTWAHFFARGFVNPIDDMHADNPASHPELLKELTDQFVASGFDLKHLVRAICNSAAYQRTSKPTGDNATDSILFSHMAVKVLSPGQLYDSLEAVVGRAQQPAVKGKKGPQRNGATPRQQFVNFFQTDEGSDPTEYQAGIPQALRLMNSSLLNRNPALLQQAMKADSPEKVLEHLFLATLSRRPTEAELQRLTAHVAKGDNKQKAYGDVLWALLNCSEFALNH